MPCQDYPSNSWSNPEDSIEYRRLKSRADMLARIACKAMNELEKQGTDDFILLRDEEVRSWWEQHKIDDAKAAAKQIEKQRIAELKKAEKQRIADLKRLAISKLSDEERKALGIK